MRRFNPSAALVPVFLIALTVAPVQSSQGQTYTVLHGFDISDGWMPTAGLSMDQRGNLYGTASMGGLNERGCQNGDGCGTVFQLQRVGSGWVFHLIYSFGGPDGGNPLARVIFAPDGALYGTTQSGGGLGYGVVFRLSPPPNVVCQSVSCFWRETVLHSFSGGTDGENPCYGDLAFDRAGNIYGTTTNGGSYGLGTVYELSPSQGGWSESVLYSFSGTDGQEPCAGVTLDNAGNLYGTSVEGGNGCTPQRPGCGVVYELTHSASGWTESVLYFFSNSGEGYAPYGGLTFDASGNLYGTTYLGGSGGGAVYELSPSNGGWTFNTLFNNFEGSQGSTAKPTMDAAGNLYGTQVFGQLTVFRLTESGGLWTLTGFNNDFGEAYGSVILDASGNLYTTTGCCNYGAVWEITP